MGDTVSLHRTVYRQTFSLPLKLDCELHTENVGILEITLQRLQQGLKQIPVLRVEFVNLDPSPLSCRYGLE